VINARDPFINNIISLIFATTSPLYCFIPSRMSSLLFLIVCALLFGKSLGSALESEEDPSAHLRRRAQGSPNPIVVENALPGNPQSEWDIGGMTAGDPSLQGFATDISVNKGNRVKFKINAPSVSNYSLKIYRLGYYNGAGARYMADATIMVTLPQTQPACNFLTATRTTDCGNWVDSAYWDIPATAVSGIYIGKLSRPSSMGSHIAFVVRDDASTSKLLFKTSDATWQAYNIYGGNSLYVGLNDAKADKVSYNRPFNTRAGGGGGGAGEDWLFNAEYPMLRWLERNGYDVTYFTDVDADRYGSLILNHQVFMSVGHDEYWSAAERSNVEAARDAGKHLAFFSGNEIYWKTRWESTEYRTLVCYKEGMFWMLFHWIHAQRRRCPALERLTLICFARLCRYAWRKRL
jgi:hypothetical protein